MNTQDSLQNSLLPPDKNLNSILYLKHLYEKLEHEVSLLDLSLKNAHFLDSQSQQSTATFRENYNENESRSLAMETFFKKLQQEDIPSVFCQILTGILNNLKKWEQEKYTSTLAKSQTNYVLNSTEECYGLLDKCITILETVLLNFSTISKHCANTGSEYLNSVTAELKDLRSIMIENSLIISKDDEIQMVPPNSVFDSVELLVLPFSSNMVIKDARAYVVDGITAKSLMDCPPKVMSEAEALQTFGKTGQAEIKENKVVLRKMMLPSKHDKPEEQLVWIYYQVFVDYPNGSELLHAISLPFAVISRSSYESRLWLLLVWQNAATFTQSNCYSTPQILPWSSLIDSINWSFVKVGRELSAQQKLYLINTIFRNEIPEDEMVSHDHFYKPNFTKEIMTDRWHSFGEWLHGCMRMLIYQPMRKRAVSSKLGELWKEGKIHGFIAKDEVQEKLNSSPKGTFILRFPEKLTDCIGLYCNSLTATLVYRDEDLNISSLQDHILTNDCLRFLYPDVPKWQAFKKTKTDKLVMYKHYMRASVWDDILWAKQLTCDNSETENEDCNPKELKETSHGMDN